MFLKILSLLIILFSYSEKTKIPNVSLNKDFKLNQSSFKNEEKLKSFSLNKIRDLNNFFKSNTPLIIHNKAIELLQKEKRDIALLLLKKNIYQNLFIPSYFTLIKSEETVFLPPLFLLFALFVISLIIFIYALIDLKSKKISSFKKYGSFLFVFMCLLSSSFFFKKRISFLEEKDIRTLPFLSLKPKDKVGLGEELILLEKNSNWLYVETSNKKKVWIQKEEFFELF